MKVIRDIHGCTVIAVNTDDLLEDSEGEDPRVVEMLEAGYTVVILSQEQNFELMVQTLTLAEKGAPLYRRKISRLLRGMGYLHNTKA